MTTNITALPFVQHPTGPAYSVGNTMHSLWLPMKTQHLLHALLIIGLYSVLGVGYVEVSYRVLRYHYRNGKLKRYFPLPTDREYISNLITAAASISPPVYLYYFYLNPTTDVQAQWLSPEKAISFKFNPIQVFIYIIGYMLMHDTLFYYLHIHAHANKWMYKWTHAFHHEYTHEMNLFTTAYAEAFENFYLTGIPWAIWATFSYHNFWLFILPISLTITTTIEFLGHSGFKPNPYFVYLNPVLFVAHQTFGPHLLTPLDHQAHHSHRRVNYGLFFRWQDKWNGTYQRVNLPAYPVEHWTRLMKDGSYMSHGKAAAFDGTRQKTQFHYEETSWGF